MSRPSPLPLVVLLFCLAAACLLPGPARGEALRYGDLELDLRPPVGFVDAAGVADALFLATQSRALPDGVLLKLYLPDAAAQRYTENRPDEITRQVSVYAARGGESMTLDKKGLDLMARSLEGAFTGYTTVPEDIAKDPAQFHAFLREAAGTGTSLRLAPIRTDNAEGHVVMQVFGADAPVVALAATALVLVNDKVLFVTATSLVTGDSPADDAAWVTATAEAFADALASAEKK